jgi:hypothetical protein
MIKVGTGIKQTQRGWWSVNVAGTSIDPRRARQLDWLLKQAGYEAAGTRMTLAAHSVYATGTTAGRDTDDTSEGA